jgi:hypothetical protein
MFKRLISCLIIVSMLWSDIAAAMNDEDEVKTSSSRRSSLVIKGTNTSPKNDTTEGSPLLNGTNGATYHTTPLTDMVSLSHPINGKKGSRSSSDEEDHKQDSSSSDERIGDKKTDKKKCPSCWSCRKKKEKEIFIIVNSSDSEEDRRSVDSRLFDEEEKKCCSPWSWTSCCKKKGGEEDVESSSSPKTCCWSPFSCCQKKGGEEDVEASPKTGCWPFSCCTKGSSGKHIGESDSLLIIERSPSLAELKKQLLLNLLIPVEEDKSNSSDVLHLEDQIVDEHDIILQKAQFLYSKIKGTSLEDFGRWFQGHVVEHRWRWQDWGGLFIAGCMAAATGAAMGPIVEWSIYNKYLAKDINEYRPFVMPLAYYINISTALIALTDSSSLMLDATSPSTKTFIVRKSPQERRADWLLIPLATIPGIYLLLLGFQVQQYHKKFTNTTGWWNEFDQFWYGTSIGFFPYLFALTFIGMRAAVSKRFHPTLPEHVRDDVLALRQLEARIDHLPDHEIHELYTVFNDPLFAQNTSKLKVWAQYSFKGEMFDTDKVEGLFNYLLFTKYAKDKFQEQEEEDQTCCTKKGFASRVLGGLGTPAGFGVIAVSLYGLFQAFMDPIPALALSLTGATLGFLPGAFLQSHNLEEAFDTIKEGIIPYLKGKCGSLKDTLTDPYAWGRGIGRVWAFFQNAVTNLTPILVSLAILIPEYLGGSDTAQTVMASVMLGVAMPYVISEMINGTVDISRHATAMFHFVQDVYQTIKKFVAKHCCSCLSSTSPDYQRRWLKKRIQHTISTTVRFTPDHVKKLNNFQRRLTEGSYL